MARTIRQIAALLHELACDLERRSKLPLDQAILLRLAREPLSTMALASALRRDRSNVRRTCALLSAAGRIERIGRHWHLNEVRLDDEVV
jgi:hypothetical protein